MIKIEKLVLGLILFYGIAWLIYTNLYLEFPISNHFVKLADSFLHGVTYFREVPYYLDLVQHQDKFYWHLGFMPAVLLMPFVLLLGSNFNIGPIQLILNLVNLYLLFKIANKLGMNKTDSIWLSIAYIFATVYLNVASIPISWYFSQIVSTSFMLFALLEFLGKKRWFLIGILTAIVLATRIHVGIVMFVFFAASLFIFDQKINLKLRLNSLIYLVIPIFISIGIIGSYNYSRFEDVFSTGYGKNINYSYGLKETPIRSDLSFAYSSGGIMSLKFIPTNFYYYFLKGYDPVLENDYSHILKTPYFLAPAYGSGILVSAPIFLFILLAPFRDKLARLSLLASIVTLLILFVWFSTNYSGGIGAIGQRFILDLAPYWFILLVMIFRNNLPAPVKGLIVITLLINIWAINGIIVRLIQAV